LIQERDPGAIEDFLHSDASGNSFPLTDRGFRKDLFNLVVSSADLIRTLRRDGGRLIFERDYRQLKTPLPFASNFFYYGVRMSILRVSAKVCSQKLSELLGTTSLNEIRNLASGCMVAFLEAHQSSTRALIDAGALPALFETLNTSLRSRL
jgi:hypothetical protein